MARRDAYKQWEGYSAFRDSRRQQEDDWNPFPRRAHAPAAPPLPPPIVSIAPKPKPLDWSPKTFECNEWRGRYSTFHRDSSDETRW